MLSAVQVEHICLSLCVWGYVVVVVVGGLYCWKKGSVTTVDIINRPHAAAPNVSQ